MIGDYQNSLSVMNEPEWHIYLDKIPYGKNSSFWVSFESDPKLTKTKSNIYGRCLPCIQNLYEQLKEGRKAITLGKAYNCWKVTAIVNGLEDCKLLLHEFEKRFPGRHVWGKFGSSRPGSTTKAVVFHAENMKDRDWLYSALKQCLPEGNGVTIVQISRACAVLYHELLGDWRNWMETAPIENPEVVEKLLERIKRILYRSST
jgi:hypothetical protein